MLCRAASGQVLCRRAAARASEGEDRGCAQGANSMSHLGGPCWPQLQPPPILHSFLVAAEVVAIFISFDFDSEDDFFRKSRASAEHCSAVYSELHFNQ